MQRLQKGGCCSRVCPGPSYCCRGSVLWQRKRRRDALLRAAAYAVLRPEVGCWVEFLVLGFLLGYALSALALVIADERRVRSQAQSRGDGARV